MTAFRSAAPTFIFAKEGEDKPTGGKSLENAKEDAAFRAGLPELHPLIPSKIKEVFREASTKFGGSETTYSADCYRKAVGYTLVAFGSIGRLPLDQAKAAFSAVWEAIPKSASAARQAMASKTETAPAEKGGSDF